MNVCLKGFRIQNYKIITDTGYCSVNENITTLIGKNESGKTIILEALKKFNFGINIKEDYLPESQHTFETVITVVFEIPVKVMNQFFEKVGLGKHFYHSEEVEISKHFPSSYRINSDQKKEWGFSSSDNELEIRFLNYLFPYLPLFFFIESRDNTFPPKMALETASKNPWYPSLVHISDFKEKSDESLPALKKLFPTLEDLRVNKLKKISVTSVSTCQKFYDPILNNFYYVREGNLVAFVVKDEGAIYGIDKLNRLQRWYLSFYLKAAYAISIQHQPIFLIDEPGILIHSHSQNRLLNKLEQFSVHYQTIFTTHSPYLIDAEKLYRIRLVEKSIDGTQIVESIYGVNDVETLSPVLAAIGFNTTPINNVKQRRNVIVEGASDLYYMEGFKKLLGEENIHFIFGGGAGNMAKVGTILRGWGCDLLYLYDNDKGGIDAEKNLKKYWLFGERDVVYVVEPEGTIEDIFHPEDFSKIILEQSPPYSLTPHESNSIFIKKNNINKVACALKFKEYLEVTEKPEFHPTTINNIRRLFQIITHRFDKLEKQQIKKLSQKTSNPEVNVL